MNFTIECIGRLLVAGVCGGLIGLERTRRKKGAGIRTHVIVAIGATLFVLVSKYGFLDIVAMEGAQVDVSRIASNVVTGVSFLGAGLIFTRADSVHGLTTAAGIWLTAAIGLAIGTGMYEVGIAATVIVLILQEILHRKVVTGMESTATTSMVVKLKDREAVRDFHEYLTAKKLSIVDTKIQKEPEGGFLYELDVLASKEIQPEDVLEILQERSEIQSIGNHFS